MSIPLHRLVIPDRAVARVPLGPERLDVALAGGLSRAALHEVYAADMADLPAAAAFSLGIALQAARAAPLLWVQQEGRSAETGRLHPPGLAALGLDPANLLMARARDVAGVLRAGHEGARCAGLGAVLIELLGNSRLLDLTASRRLVLTAERSGVLTLLLRAGAAQPPSAAATRWIVRALPSRALPAGAPGHPVFAARLVRQRGGGAAEGEWRLEWDRDRQQFRERGIADGAPLLRPLVPLPADGSPAAEGIRRAS